MRITNTAMMMAIALGLALAGGCHQAHRADAQAEPASGSQIMQMDYAPAIAKVLEEAGDNRDQLQAVLDHYGRLGDKRKIKAAEFLIANMGPQGFAEAALFDKDGKEIAYNSLGYDNFAQALAAREALDQEHGELSMRRKQWVADVKVITAEYLIENIDRAFEAWRNNPWSANVTFETFCNYILPYRGSNEPIGRWREACRLAVAAKLASVEDVHDIRAISRACKSQEGVWARFDEKCYLHPTDQSFEQMLASGLGRCEDLSNLQMYLNRANGVPIAGDYTPAWARANNNHAWTVVLDGEGRALARRPAMNGAAKIYRKMYAAQPNLPTFNRKPGETIPPWLAGEGYRDVTAEYRTVHQVSVQLSEPIPEKSSWAYLCVFNSGQWTPIAAGKIDALNRTAHFPDVGGNIAYYPAYFVDKELIPAGPIHVLHTDGTVEVLDTPVDESSPRIATEIRQTKDVDISPDTGKPIPAIHVEPGQRYELFYWLDQWVSLGVKESGRDAMQYDNLPAGRLYRLRKLDGRDEERPFTIENGKQILW